MGENIINVKLSASKLNLLRECPRCFWLLMVKNVRRPSFPMPSVVNRFDAIVKQYFDKYRMIGELPPMIAGQITGRLPTNMPKMMQYEVDNEILVWGKPDDFFELQGGITVPLDHKTKSRPPDEIHPAYQLQLDVYSYLLQMNEYNTVGKGLLVYYSPNTGDLNSGMPLQCTVMEVITDPKHVISMIHQARNVLKGSIPKPGEHCQFCTWLEIMNKNNFT